MILLIIFKLILNNIVLKLIYLSIPIYIKNKKLNLTKNHGYFVQNKCYKNRKTLNIIIYII